jgi:hypothetical protein
MTAGFNPIFPPFIAHLLSVIEFPFTLEDKGQFKKKWVAAAL